MTAGDRERVSRDEQARPGNDSAIDAVANGHVGEARAFAIEIAHSRETGFQIPFHGGDRLHGSEGLRLGDDRRRASLVFGLQHHVSVTVDQPGNTVKPERSITRVPSGSLGIQAGGHLFDPIAANDDQCVLNNRAVRPG